MPLQIRRGNSTQRGAITPLPGELIYDTTDNKLYVGTASPGTVGGISINGINVEDAADAAAALFSTGSHSGITFVYNDAAGRIDATVTVAATGPFDGDLTGSVFADDSTLLVDGTGGRLVGPLATSGLAGNLPVNGFDIVSTSNGNINISPNGTGQVLINSGLTITGNVTKAGNLLVNTTGGNALQLGTSVTNVDGNLVMIRNSFSSSPLSGFFFAQHHDTQQAVKFTFYRTRGQGLATQQLVNGDEILGFNFVGQGPSSTTPVAGASLAITVDGTPTVGNVPSKFQFGTNNGSANAVRAELSAAGIWKINQLGAFSGTTINVVDNNNITIGDVRLNADGLSAINTNASLTLSANGSGSVDIESVRIQGNTISTTDSSGITVSQASTFSSNLTVDGTLTIGDSIVQTSVNKDYVTTTLQTQGSARVVQGVHNGTYTQLVSSTAETFTTITYNSTTFRGGRATVKVSWGSTVVFIGEVLLANSPTTVTIVNAQATEAIIASSPVSSVTADYDSTTGSIRLRLVTSASIPAGANYNWTVSYQLFT